MSQDPEVPVRIFSVESEPPNDTLGDESGPAWLVEPPTLNSLRTAFASFAEGHVEQEHVAALSDLDRERLAYLRDHWSDLAPEVRTAVVSTSTDLADAHVTVHFGRFLRYALEDPSPVVRQFAILGLATYDQPEVAEALLAHVEQDPSEDVRAEAAGALADWAELLDSTPASQALGHRMYETLVRLAMQPAEAHHVRAQALEAASRFPADARIRQLIDEFYGEDETGLRLSAVVAMGNTGDRQWLPVLSIELQSDDNELRRAAAEALGNVGDGASLLDLVKAMRDDEAEVRHAAIWAIAAIPGPGSKRILKELADNPLPEDAPVIQAALSLDEDLDDL